MENDFAIVVGISQYPGLVGPNGMRGDLKGPDNDAKAVYDWLISSDGGAVPKTQAWLIRTADFNEEFARAADAYPKQNSVTDKFNHLDYLADQAEKTFGNPRVGRRLYVYMSGHGFAPNRCQACVFTAEATNTQTRYHIYVTSWMDWFYRAHYFDELILWADCCLDFNLTVRPEPGGFRDIVDYRAATGMMFGAYAAKYPGRAVEQPFAEDDGKYHGVFTWTLLQGLKTGNAADFSKIDDAGKVVVTSESLKRYLTNNMDFYMLPQHIENGSISKIPDIWPSDEINICSVNWKPKSIFSLPTTIDYAEATVKKGGSANEAIIASGIVNKGILHVSIIPGLYYVEVPSMNFSAICEAKGGIDSPKSG